MNKEILEKCNEVIIRALRETEERKKLLLRKSMAKNLPMKKPDENGSLGTAILDATCAPTHIRYPQDFSRLNEARVKLEGMIDWFYKAYGFDKKPHTYRRVVRQDYRDLIK